MKKIVLEGLRRLVVKECDIPNPVEGHRILKVIYCAVCRTDAKMWEQGHRELVFPRVAGHEIAAVDENGKRFVLWPGTSCGKCPYCLSGRENLCESMKIIGFHLDGGFAEYILVHKKSLVPVPDGLAFHIACFAEPVGCALNGIEKLHLTEKERILIYGGGSIGLITALLCRSFGAVPLVIEKREEKIKKAGQFLESTGIKCVKNSNESDFDAVINACPDPAALGMGIVKLRKGGRLSFFSGITKNKNMETNLINLIHYKELEICGSYGLTRKHMISALPFMEKNQMFFEMLVEEIVKPETVQELMPKVLSGKNFKYILNFTENLQEMYFGKSVVEGPVIRPLSDKNSSVVPCTEDRFNGDGSVSKNAYKINGNVNENINEQFTRIINKKNKATVLDLEDKIMEKHLDVEKNVNGIISNNSYNAQKICKSVIESIVPVAGEQYAAAQDKIDNKTKPLGALGKLEDLAVQMCLIQNTLDPVINGKAMFVFAGDHGITEEGVSAFPSEVTFQMVDNFLKGGAAINVLCRHHNIDIKIVDMGVNADFKKHPDLIIKKVRKGTRNFAIEEAMTEKEVFEAIAGGMEAFFYVYDQKKIDIVGLGEMGIGNTTSASSIISAVTGISPLEATGRGTGIDDKVLAHKTGIIEKALNFHQPDPENGYEVLRKIGGYEIAGIAGAVLAAASKGTAVVLDGVISTAAGLIAYVINPKITGYVISGHKSVEISQKAALAHMGLDPVIDLNMRLGEGTGAALTINIADAACRIMREMASFDDAGVSNQDTGK